MTGWRIRAATLIAAGVFGVVAACAPLRELPPDPEESPRLHLSPAKFDSLPGWNLDQQGDGLLAFLRSCNVLLRKPADQSIGGAVSSVAGDWRGPCEAAKLVDPRDHYAARRYFEDWFQPWAVSDGTREAGLFTGYFEPELFGSLVQGGAYQVPLYRRPDDLVTVDLGKFRDDLTGTRIAGRVNGTSLVPYFTRTDIDAGALTGSGFELVWVDDAVDAFFLHIQGSGRIRLPDGTYRRAGYAAVNGHRYYAIGRTLIARGEVTREHMSMQAIRHWLDTNPDKALSLMQENPSFVFFRWVDGVAGSLGPLGAQNVPLSAGRSLAIDRKYLALGLPLWLETELPGADGTPSVPIRRLVIAQDTGGAIKGIVRGDLFIGTGDAPGEIAGRMQEHGRYWIFMPRPRL